MTHKQLVEQLSLIQSSQARDLVKILNSWTLNNETIASLHRTVESYLNRQESSQLEARKSWDIFVVDSIRTVDGMTMNERLFVFGLMKRWDRTLFKVSKHKIYAKVHAKP